MINFQDYSTSDNEKYLDYLRMCIQIPSNLSPTFLLYYNNRLNYKRGYESGLCWHKFIDYDGVEKWSAPAGDWDEINWSEVFKSHVPKGTIFDAVPEYLVNIWQNQLGAAVEVKEKRDYWDYVLYLDRMEKLEGKKLKGFRQGRNSFEKSYEYTVENLTPNLFDELKNFQSDVEKNLQQRAKKLNFAEDDNAMFSFALEHWNDIKNLFGFVIRVEGKIVAYSIDEQIDDTNSIGLFAKANYNFSGVNQFNYWCDAKANLERGILTENIMDDVGEENLRFFKEHLSPLVMLKKFTVIYKMSDYQKISTVQMYEEHSLN